MRINLVHRVLMIACATALMLWAMAAHAQSYHPPRTTRDVAYWTAAKKTAKPRPARAAAVNETVQSVPEIQKPALDAVMQKPSASKPANDVPGAVSGVLDAVMGKQSANATPWTIVATLTILTVLPAIILAMTPMVRLLVVFHFLRQALGTQTAPSNQVLMGLALMMTWFLMQPVLVAVDQQAVEPFRAGVISGAEAMERGVVPVKNYMLHYAREKDLELFASAVMTQKPEKPGDLPMQVVTPAYMLSELKAGFQIGAILFLPFLLVDVMVASLTTAIGMMQLPPVVVSTPLKILLFVVVDGWHLLAESLLKSF